MTKAILEKINLAEMIFGLRCEVPSFCFKLIICLPTLSPESPHRAYCELVKKKFKGDFRIKIDLS